VSRKFWLILYLAVWSTIAARLSFEFVYLFVPKRGDMGAAAAVVPFVAFPVSCSVAFLMLRANRKVSAVVGRYLWRMPIVLYALLLCATAAMAATTSPAALPIVLFFGALFGLPALVVGTMLHAIGLFPLIYFDDRFFARDDQSANIDQHQAQKT